MSDFNTDLALSALEVRRDQILRRFFVPVPLVQPGRTVESLSALKEQFDAAVSLYREKRFRDAQRAFLDLEREAESASAGGGRTACINAAACAVANGENELVTELLGPIYRANRLFGLPLWNFALALHRLDDDEGALDAVEMWLAKAPNQAFSFQAHIVSAALARSIGHGDRASPHLTAAAEIDRRTVLRELGLDSGVRPAEASASQDQDYGPATKALQEQLSRIVPPRRPNRSPHLAALLPEEEVRKLDHALEVLGDGDSATALADLDALIESRGRGTMLDGIAGAILLFVDRSAEAHDLLASAMDANPPLRIGTNLWNLACSQIRTGRLRDAQSTLEACSRTEYRSSPTLNVALDLLGGRPSPSPETVLRVSRGPKHLADQLPSGIDDARKEVLRRLIRPKRLQHGYKPDLTRLPQRDLRNVERVLETVRHQPPAHAAQLLLPLLHEHPSIYTLKVHAAAYTLLQGTADSVIAAQKLLRDAEKIRQLDAVSRMNLAYCCLERGDLSGVTSALAGAEQSSMAQQYSYWLTVAVARAATDTPGSGEAAAKALALTPDGPSQTEASLALNACGIQPAATETHDPMRAAAARALSSLKNNDLTAAVLFLENTWQLKPQWIQEIGPTVLEPQFFSRPGPWDPEVVAAFLAGVADYGAGKFADAADTFAGLLKDFRATGIAANAVASCVKSAEPRRAINLLGGAERRRLSTSSRAGWTLVYNLALAYLQLADFPRAAALIEQRLAGRGRRPRVRETPPPAGPLTNLLVHVCATGVASRPEFVDTLATALESVRKAADPPSDELLISLAWTRLSRRIPDVDGARNALESVATGGGAGTLKPPADITSPHQVREAYASLSEHRGPQDAIAYLQAVIAARQGDRHSAAEASSSERFVKSVGTELAGRLCLVDAYSHANQFEDALQALDEAESLILENRNCIPPGFLALDWRDLTRTALALRIPWAAQRFVQSGLQADAERPDLLAFQVEVAGQATPEAATRLGAAAEAFAAAVRDHGVSAEEVLVRLEDTLRDSELPEVQPLLAEHVQALLDTASRRDASQTELEELTDRTWLYARMLLPEEAATHVRDTLNWFARRWSAEAPLLPLDIRVYDDTVWPRDDEREACCLLSVTSTSKTPLSGLTLEEPLSRRILWEGDLEVARTQWVRWIIERDDGFAPGDLMDVRVDAVLRGEPSDLRMAMALPVTVAERPPRWPNLPTGALTPDDVLDLYGRTAIIHQVIRGLGPRRAQATLFLEAPRQMGKTSILRFIERLVPSHVLALYVNLERAWGESSVPNLWSYLAANALVASGLTSAFEDSPLNTPEHFVRVVSRACEQLQREYVLLLLDEFRVVLDRDPNPAAVLSELRAFHDDPRNRISLLIADRLTRAELESRCEHDIWAQVTSRPVGPLDIQAIGRALSIPSIGSDQSDIEFLPETVSALHQLTAGYPYHVIRAANAIIDRRLFDGPWVVALPTDVDAIVPILVDQDELFRIGLCRPDRIENTLEDAIAALLEWGDLGLLLEDLRREPEWKDTTDAWSPPVEDFLAGVGFPDDLLRRLAAVGVVRGTGVDYDVFSPLLEMWLRKMRDHGRRLGSGSPTRDWSVSSFGDGADVRGDEWQSLDTELIQRCERLGKPSPLKSKLLQIGDWRQLEIAVDSAASFEGFVAAAFRVFIDERANGKALKAFPRLLLAYHGIRLARNYYVHNSRRPSAVNAWNQLCTRALRRRSHSYRPTRGEEWSKLRSEILRTLYTAYRSAVTALEGAS